jgi:sugar lactone lactonase YvrE
MAAAELVVDARARLGEGPVWDAERQKLYWVDIQGQAIRLFDPESQTDQIISLGQMVGAVAPRAGGGLVAALQDGFALVDELTGEAKPVNGPLAGFPQNRFNDGKCDPQGRFWAGTMSLEKQRKPTGSLFLLDADHQIYKKLDGILVSNGLAWSQDGRLMYYIDTGLLRVDVFDFEPVTATLSNRRTVIRVPEELGHPDGMTIDEQGKLWIALWGGSAISRWDPASGTLLELVRLPARLVTSCTFGGPDLDDLYITTARTGLDESVLAQQPQAGGLFRLRTGARGCLPHPFAG